MIDVLALDGMTTMSIAYPYSVGNYKVMAINVNLVQDNG